VDDVVLVLATVHLPDGIKPGTYYWVDRSKPYIDEAINADPPILVLIEEGNYDLE
jgi:hypothetical protein